MNSVGDDKGDRKAAVLIRDAARRLFAERGVAGTTVREIAATAGVSASLAIHHYGSKEALKTAADEHAAAFVEEMLAELVRMREEGGATIAAELFVKRLPEGPALAAYARRLLVECGPAGDALFDPLNQATLAGMARLVGLGVVLPAADEKVRAVLLANDLPP